MMLTDANSACWFTEAAFTKLMIAGNSLKKLKRFIFLIWVKFN